MIIGPFLAAALGVAVYVLPRRSMWRDDAHAFGLLLVVGFIVRLALHYAFSELPLFSHGATSRGDAANYEQTAWAVANLWYAHGISFFDRDELLVLSPDAAQAALAINVFAVVAYLNGGESSSLGCVAINAFLAAVTVFQLYRLGTNIGGGERESRFVALAMYFSPAYLFHTADLFKDGLSAFLVITAVTTAFRLSRAFNPIDVVVGAVCLLGLWYVRFYLVFLVSAPFAMSLLGIRSGAASRVAISALFILAAGIALVGTELADQVVDAGVATYERATSENSLDWNARGGSGVRFDDSNPWIAFPQRLFYTLFSPFPWDFRSTSIGFQLGKIEALIWYYFGWHGFKVARQMWREDRGTLMMFLVVLLPLTVAYAMTMANIGLIVRQRIPIVLLASVLAVRSTTLIPAWLSRPQPRMSPVQARSLQRAG